MNIITYTLLLRRRSYCCSAYEVNEQETSSELLALGEYLEECDVGYLYTESIKEFMNYPELRNTDRYKLSRGMHIRKRDKDVIIYHPEHKFSKFRLPKDKFMFLIDQLLSFYPSLFDGILITVDTFYNFTVTPQGKPHRCAKCNLGSSAYKYELRLKRGSNRCNGYYIRDQQLLSSETIAFGEFFIDQDPHDIRDFLEDNNRQDYNIHNKFEIQFKKEGNNIVLYDELTPSLQFRMPLDKFRLLFNQWFKVYHDLPEVIDITIDNKNNPCVKSRGECHRCSSCAIGRFQSGITYTLLFKRGRNKSSYVVSEEETSPEIKVLASVLSG